MEPLKVDAQKMFKMGGDQPSFTMDELSSSESKTEAAKERDKRSLAYQISPIASRSDRLAPYKEDRRPRDKDSLLRVKETRRDTKTEIDTGPNRALVQAVVGSRRWPPHVALLWAAALLLTHALHAAAAMLGAAAPPARKLCVSLRQRTQQAWLRGHRRLGALLAAATGLAGGAYCALYALHAAAAWAIEPLHADPPAAPLDRELALTDYDDLDLRTDKSEH